MKVCFHGLVTAQQLDSVVFEGAQTFVLEAMKGTGAGTSQTNIRTPRGQQQREDHALEKESSPKF